MIGQMAWLSNLAITKSQAIKTEVDELKVSNADKE